MVRIAFPSPPPAAPPPAPLFHRLRAGTHLVRIFTAAHGVANRRDTLRRGVIPVVLEEVPPDLEPASAFASFADWRAKGGEFLDASAQRRHAYARPGASYMAACR